MNLSHGGGDSLPPLLIGYDDAARLLGIGRRTLEELVYTASMPSVTVGKRRLFRLSDLEAWVAARATTAVTEPLSDLH